MKKTIANLTKAFIGESQARNRYSMYAKIAKKEGYEQLSGIFLLTAENEREHAKWLYRMINSLKQKTGDKLSSLTVEAEAPLTLGSTADNLKSAIEGEHYENTQMYPSYADVAEQEGYPEVANRLRAISKAEEHHEERFSSLLAGLEGETLYKKRESIEWVCRKCGFVHGGENPPAECPSCDHPARYFEVKCEIF